MQLSPRAARVVGHVLGCNSAQIYKFPRCYRISRSEGFSPILRQQAKNTNWFAIHWQDGNATHARLGVSVGKRAVSSAVVRNRVKRLIRECFRGVARQGMNRDIVIRLRKQLEFRDQQEAIKALTCELKSILSVAR